MSSAAQGKKDVDGCYILWPSAMYPPASLRDAALRCHQSAQWHEPRVGDVGNADPDISDIHLQGYDGLHNDDDEGGGTLEVWTFISAACRAGRTDRRLLLPSLCTDASLFHYTHMCEVIRVTGPEIDESMPAPLEFPALLIVIGRPDISVSTPAPIAHARRHVQERWLMIRSRIP
jgi:hypothetical protein